MRHTTRTIAAKMPAPMPTISMESISLSSLFAESANRQFSFREGADDGDAADGAGDGGLVGAVGGFGDRSPPPPVGAGRSLLSAGGAMPDG